MSLVEPRRRPFRKSLMHVIRRSHLYLGLFLVPWAVLYGVTAFLFNHPTAFAETSATPFAADALQNTPLATPPSAGAVAAQVVAALNERAGTSRYALADAAAAFNRDFFTASVRQDDGQQLTLFIDVAGEGGSVRGQPPRREEAKPAEKAPFAIGATASPGRGQRAPGGRGGPREAADGLKLPEPLPERVKAAVPAVLEKLGFAVGVVTVTGVPDVTFRITDAETDKTWAATYSPLAGTVGGKPAEGEPKESISVRRFLTRLHVAHGYPSSGGARWWWAVIVDAMAFEMVFWGVSGLLMWWQLKATRTLGSFALLASAIAATALGVGMYRALTG